MTESKNPDNILNIVKIKNKGVAQMTESLKIKITLKDNDLTEREKVIVHTLNAYLISCQYNILTQKGMAMNFLDKQDDDLTHYDLVFEQPLDDETLNTYKYRLGKVIPNAYKMSNISTDKLEIIIQ